MSIDWAGIALERATGLKLNEYIQKNITHPLGLHDMSMIPSADMRARLAHMHHRGEDGRIRARDHLLRQPVVVDTEDEETVARVFNSGGAGMYAKPQEYTSTSTP
ncbi:serine hydrolase [Candidatus Bathyarchaeota archaeon]|nr:serine hydrolase [Candidatus Bathyarchaeota archaeon]